ncbi:MAG: hypothetical protein GY808_00310 [Gammaproteobacteria bacterium]|nr:hypothetical protein [Gammaproteobacteria bacterium]
MSTHQNNQKYKQGIASWIPPVLIVALCLAILTVVVSSYIRLAESGLGCEPWPACYGEYHINKNTQGINVLTQNSEKAVYRGEKIAHRLIASSLGLIICLIFILSWKKNYQKQIGRLIPGILFSLIVILAVIGPLKPVAPVPALTFANYTGGLLIVALLFYLYRQIKATKEIPVTSVHRGIIRWGLILVFIQILWGGWTSANYAGNSCEKLMTCNHLESNDATVLAAINPVSGLLLDQQSRVIMENKMQTIQLIHHILAILSFVIFTLITFLLLRNKNDIEKNLRKNCLFVVSLLLLQFIIGLGAIAFQLPLMLVVLHNFLAALLLMVITVLHMNIYKRTMV